MQSVAKLTSVLSQNPEIWIISFLVPFFVALVVYIGILNETENKIKGRLTIITENLHVRN